jgi:site-specific DNA-cytosine methylase
MTANRTAKKETTNLGTTLSDVAWVLPLEELERVAKELPTRIDESDGRNAFKCEEGEQYLPAVEHWASIRGGPVPWPNDEKRRLSPAFAEWMMGFPIGYTDIPGVSRSARLRCIGNAVAPPAVALAWSVLTGEQP